MTDRINANPAGGWPTGNYPIHQAVVEPDGRRVHLTGQVAWDPEGAVIGPGDAYRQTLAALDHIERILASMGGNLDDIVSLTTYYVRAEDKQPISDARAQRLNPAFAPVGTGVEVKALWHPDLLVELTPIAVIPANRFHPPDDRP